MPLNSRLIQNIIFVVHFTLAVMSMTSKMLGNDYLLCQSLIVALGCWCLTNQENSEPLYMPVMMFLLLKIARQLEIDAGVQSNSLVDSFPSFGNWKTSEHLHHPISTAQYNQNGGYQHKNYLSTHRILRALFSRFICLCHIGFSIFVLYTVKNKELIYLVPLFGALFLLIETFLVIVFTKGREPTAWFSPAFFIYVCTIVSCYWLLELENIKKTLLGKRDKTVAVNYDTNGDIISFIKIIWSQLEIQIFFALILFVRWIIPKSNLSPQGLAELLVKYFAISCDMLDFLTILSDVTLVKNVEIVYATLSIWTWSTFQFFIYVPKYEDEEKKEFNAYISNSLLSVLFMDLPYLGLRVTTIFGLGSHNYNSYYFAVKNCLMILLQVVRIRAAFQERKIRSDKYASKLKDRHGTDKAPARLFDQNEMAKIKFANRFKNEENIPKTVLIELGVHDTQDVSLHLQKLSVDVDNQVEDLPQPPPHSINHTVSPYRHQPPVNMKIYSPVSNKGDDEDEQPPQPISKPLQSNSRTSLNPPKATTTRLPPTIKKANQVVTNAAVGMNLKNYTTNPMNRPANTNIRPAQTHTEI